jgi:carbon monoxide dehydrogenase subunit G
MKFENEFVVGRDIESVWNLLEDVGSVAQCMPGAELTADKGEGVYEGRVSVKLGPLNPTFEGEAKAVYDAEKREIRLDGSGIDKRGGSRGRVIVLADLHEANGSTTVAVNANITLSGAAARFGRTGLMEEMANRLIREFVDCLEAKLAADTRVDAAEVQADELRGFSLVLAGIRAWFSRQLRRILGRKQE